ncbi:hypothetical protein C6568_03790 [Melaminivora suipulveris]|uniref:Uncharacterized protein n=1 Tax=Melaminivora suipulveris TaxID=2109913 RepID=A0A2R3Q9P3_9BURK|nr:Mu-like prophage major head subunit gpT family protein [Melaminivora suipulveris]AVO48479.1 hypothetical protein C6568_03790 [Melaminivora suipulveris]
MTTLHRTLQIELAGAPADDDAPLPAVIATDSPVSRDGLAEILDCTAAGVDLSRAPLPLIVAHDARRLAVGVVDNIQPAGRVVRALVRFGSSAEARAIRADVVAGIHRSLSVGYSHLDNGTPTEGGIVYRWQPHEVSLVPVPADPAAGFFRSRNQPETTTMNQDTEELMTRAEIDGEINALCKQYGTPDLARGLVSSGASLDDTKAAILHERAMRDRTGPQHRPAPMDHFMLPDTSRLPLGALTRARQADDERQLIADSLAARMGVRSDRPVLHGLAVVDLARRALELSGTEVRPAWNRSQIIERAMGMHTTSDFPQLLGTAAHRVLHDGYDVAPPALKSVARLVSARDFRERTTVRLSGASLERVNEHGEYKAGAITEAAAGWKLQTYGRIFAVTRQALVNDDLDALGGLLRQFGQAAAQREADELVDALLNPVQIDGKDVFSTARGTQITPKLSAAGLAAAVLALRTQKDADGRPLSQQPGTLIVPAALEMTALQLVATINATEAKNVQPYRLSVQVEPRLDDASTTAWFLVATNQSALEYGYLDGQAGPQVTTREGFEVDGLEVKASMDFGCGFVAPHGWVKSTGTTT